MCSFHASFISLQCCKSCVLLRLRDRCVLWDCINEFCSFSFVCKNCTLNCVVQVKEQIMKLLEIVNAPCMRKRIVCGMFHPEYFERTTFSKELQLHRHHCSWMDAFVPTHGVSSPLCKHCPLSCVQYIFKLRWWKSFGFFLLI